MVGGSAATRSKNPANYPLAKEVHKLHSGQNEGGMQGSLGGLQGLRVHSVTWPETSMLCMFSLELRRPRPDCLLHAFDLC